MKAHDLARAIRAGDVSALPEDALASWVTAQRWFSSKLREVNEFRVLDLVPLESADPIVAIAIAEARFGSGRHEVYQVPIAVRPLSSGWDEGVIYTTGAHVVYDALVDEAADAVLAGQFAAAATIERPAGCVRFHWDASVAPPSAQPVTRMMAAEQSNTSVVLDERLALKVFRRIQPGINPELEMLRFLAAQVRLHGRADGRDARCRAALRRRGARRLGGRARCPRRRGSVVSRPARRARLGHRTHARDAVVSPRRSGLRA
jgi:maltokinase